MTPATAPDPIIALEAAPLVFDDEEAEPDEVLVEEDVLEDEDDASAGQVRL